MNYLPSLTKIKLYSSHTLTDSHELAMFLELYSSNPWSRSVSMYHSFLVVFSSFFKHVILAPVT